MEGPKPPARCGHALATIDRRVILFGGHSGNRGPLLPDSIVTKFKFKC